MAGVERPVVLGLWDGHDSGVALAVDGQLRFALNEERVTRRKRASGFPHGALASCLERTGLDPADIGLVAVAGRFGRLAHRVADGAYRRSDPSRDPLSIGSTIARRVETGIARVPGLRALEARGSRAVLVRRLRGHGIQAPICDVPHHDAHAWSARLVQPAPGSMLVTMDGYGDGLAATFDALDADARIELDSPSHSIALVYGATTRVLGFREGDEGKVMGLAASGTPDPALREWFRKVIAFGRCDPRLGGRRRREELAVRPREDVAAALQARVEEVALGWIEARRRGRGHLAVAGGLFANVALNGRLAERFDGFAVFPHMGDGGLCVGAAAAACRGELAFGAPFYGPEYAPRELVEAARAAGLEAQETADPEGALLGVIRSGGLTGRFLGRSELGPRALGHRSILLRADAPALADTLNQRLERDEFMPFAPVRRAGAGSATMTVVVRADEALRERCPAAVHVDGTSRTQIVDAAVDPGLDRLLEGAESLGMPALINTSFNRHGEPIVESPQDAIRTFLAAGLDALQLGEHLLIRRPA